jgi:hypothetical protein
MLPDPRGANERNADPRIRSGSAWIRVGSARETIRENLETQSWIGGVSPSVTRAFGGGSNFLASWSFRLEFPTHALFNMPLVAN